MMPKLLIVAQQQGWPVDLRQHHIEIAVAVDVRIRRTATDDGLQQIFPALRARNRDKARAFLRIAVPKELRGLAISLAALKFGNLLLDVTVAREHVEPAIEIVIKKEQTELQQL